MNRLEFIGSCANLTEQELAQIAQESRRRASSRIPEETRRMFRSLDDVTKINEEYVGTTFGCRESSTSFKLISGIVPSLVLNTCITVMVSAANIL